jgi:hypothetical protein
MSIYLAYNYREYLSKTVLFVLLMSMMLARNTVYIGGTCLHSSPGECLIMGIMILINVKFPIPLEYAFSFFTALSSDVVNGMLHPANNFLYTWYYGICGAGFHDGLFGRFGKWLFHRLVSMMQLTNGTAP